MKTVSVYGCTGSIGVQTLEIIRQFKDEYKVKALVAGRNDELLIKQALEFEPEMVGIVDEQKADSLKNRLPSDIRVFSGKDAANTIAQNSTDIAVCAIVGMAGLDSFLTSLKNAEKVCLANKESLVCAGELLSEDDYKKIVPVDSEHSAIFQCIGGHDKKEISKLILTGSGGPFKDLPLDKFRYVELEDALKHPNWSMGQKISIDSATMMNKGLEFIEAVRLFKIDPDKIEILVHSDSIIHSMVEFVDGSTLAQLGMPDMRVPIQYALTYPNRQENKISQKLDLAAIGTLHFDYPNFNRFPCLKLAIEALKKGGLAPTAMNSANEAAVQLFLNKKINFISIPLLVEYVLKNYQEAPLTVENIHLMHDSTINLILSSFNEILN